MKSLKKFKVVDEKGQTVKTFMLATAAIDHALALNALTNVDGKHINRYSVDLIGGRS